MSQQEQNFLTTVIDFLVQCSNLAGLADEVHVRVPNELKIPDSANELFSYLLAEPNVGKRVRVDIRGTEKPKYDKPILLFSGGIDSLCVMKIFGGIPLFVHYGEKYNDIEWEFAQKFEPLRIDVKLVRDESWDYVIPMRNLILAAIGASLSNEVWICATSGDHSRDKTEYFFEEASKLLSIVYGRDIRVLSPCFNMTKTQLVSEYLSEGNSVDVLKGAVSCYERTEGSDLLCGTCGACFRRAVAFKVNGLHDPAEYEVDPLVAQREKYLKKIAVWDDIERVFEILGALRE